MMITSTILLSQDGRYVDKDGNLPKRPSFDKELLTTLCTDAEITPEGNSMLPPSIRSIVRGVSLSPTIGITIREIDAFTDLLIVVRSPGHLPGGKKFDLHRSFKNIVTDSRIELWSRK